MAGDDLVTCSTCPAVIPRPRRGLQCVDCINTTRRGWAARNRGLQRAADARNYERNGEAIRRRNAGRRARLRAEILEVYGARCVCCGESEPEFLTLDHVGGRRDSHVGATTYTVYLRIKREGFPRDRYRLLCWNCNVTIGQLGYCPHERKLKAVS